MKKRIAAGILCAAAWICVIGIFCSTLQFIAEVIRLVAGLPQFVPQFIDSPLILGKFPFHIVEGGGGVI